MLTHHSYGPVGSEYSHDHPLSPTQLPMSQFPTVIPQLKLRSVEAIFKMQISKPQLLLAT